MNNYKIKIKLKDTNDQENNSLGKSSFKKEEYRGPIPSQLTKNVHHQLDTQRKIIRKYTLDIFLERAREVYGTKFDYSQITEQDIRDCKSHVSIKCHIC